MSPNNFSENFSRYRAETAILTDDRIRTMNEVISGIRVIKMYGWEKPFAALVDEVRRYNRAHVVIFFNSYLPIFKA